MTQQLYVQSNCMEVKRPKHLSSISFENQIWHCTSASGDEKKRSAWYRSGRFYPAFSRGHLATIFHERHAICTGWKGIARERQR